jgi:hypothetical protein
LENFGRDVGFQQETIQCRWQGMAMLWIELEGMTEAIEFTGRNHLPQSTFFVAAEL